QRPVAGGAADAQQLAARGLRRFADPCGGELVNGRIAVVGARADNAPLVDAPATLYPPHPEPPVAAHSAEVHYARLGPDVVVCDDVDATVRFVTVKCDEDVGRGVMSGIKALERRPSHTCQLVSAHVHGCVAEMTRQVQEDAIGEQLPESIPVPAVLGMRQ